MITYIVAHSDKDRAEMLSDFFSTCFNTELSPLSFHNQYSHICDSTISRDLLCTNEEIFFLLSSLNSSKATGLDGISACTFRSTADSLSLAYTFCNQLCELVSLLWPCSYEMKKILYGANTKVISSFFTKSVQIHFLVKYT